MATDPMSAEEEDEVMRSAYAITAVLLSGIILSLPGCSGGDSVTAQPTRRATITTLELSSTSIKVGEPVSLTAAVAATGNTAPSGPVTFADGMTSLGTQSLDAGGNASLSTSSLAVGTHALSASYAGNASFLGSTSTATNLAVAKPEAESTVTLSVMPDTAGEGMPVALSAAVSANAPGGATLPTGTVTFSIGTATLGISALDPTGSARFTSTLLPVGSDAITAAYSGDANFTGSTSPFATVAIFAQGGSAYTNPLALRVNASTLAASCADPAILKVQQNSVDTWYLYCTSDQLYTGDTSAHYINIFQSFDLVNWTYDGNAFSSTPSWANVSGASLWAPAIKVFNGTYYLYFAASSTGLAGGGEAIGVGTSSSPAGPFVDHGAPVVEPELAANCCSGTYRWTIDPDVTEDTSGQKYILFGSFNGGLYVRKLSADGFTSDASSEQLVAVDNRYEGGNWWVHDGYYYLFASSTNCCNGPLTGYGVYVGRATTPMGPYVDAQGVSMLAVNAGGTPVLHMNGNGVLGPGGNVIFTDEVGQDYILYHGVLADAPYYSGQTGYTARPAFLDLLGWVNGWPVVRDGLGPSDATAPQPMPAAQPGATRNVGVSQAIKDTPGTLLTSYSDDFTQSTLAAQWSFLHATPVSTLTGSGYQVATVDADPVSAMESVPLLSETAPTGDVMIETKVDLNLPLSGVGPDYAQAGLVLYGNDDNFLRVDLYNNNDTRQIEFVKASAVQIKDYPRWGVTNLGPPAVGPVVTAWLRLVRRNVNGQEHYTAYSSNDGSTWIQGGTWVHSLGAVPKICLYAGNRSGYSAIFHYVHVFTLFQ